MDAEIHLTTDYFRFFKGGTFHEKRILMIVVCLLLCLCAVSAECASIFIPVYEGVPVKQIVTMMQKYKIVSYNAQGELVCPDKVTYEDENHTTSSLGIIYVDYPSYWEKVRLSTLTGSFIIAVGTQKAINDAGMQDYLTAFAKPDTEQGIIAGGIEPKMRVKSIEDLQKMLGVSGTAPTDSTTPASPTATVNRVNYSLSGSTAAVIGPESRDATNVTIPKTVKVDGKSYKVTEIKASAFKGMKKLTSVTIGENVKTIGKSAFQNCAKLKTITIKAKKLTSSSIKSSAFKGIYSKATFKCPKGKAEAYRKILLKKGAPKTCRFK